jgi:hypothetical protein
MYGNVECSEVESDGEDLGNKIGIKYVHCDIIWKQEHFTHDPKPQDFIEVSKPNFVWNHFPTMMQLFDLFGSFNILQDIVNETN